jgi:Zinc-finger double-stranded RNA-binding
MTRLRHAGMGATDYPRDVEQFDHRKAFCHAEPCLPAGVGGRAQGRPGQDRQHRPNWHHRQVRAHSMPVQAPTWRQRKRAHALDAIRDMRSQQCQLLVLLSRRAALDEDVPAFGKNYCATCSRYFVTPHALTAHSKSKDHKRRSAGNLISTYL